MNKKKTVSPIKSLADIGKIKRHLLKTQQYRNYLLFVMGINVGLRISDLLSLRISDVWQNGKCVEAIVIREQKTKKYACAYYCDGCAVCRFVCVRKICSDNKQNSASCRLYGAVSCDFL